MTISGPFLRFRACEWGAVVLSGLLLFIFYCRNTGFFYLTRDVDQDLPNNAENLRGSFLELACVQNDRAKIGVFWKQYHGTAVLPEPLQCGLVIIYAAGDDLAVVRHALLVNQNTAAVYYTRSDHTVALYAKGEVFFRVIKYNGDIILDIFLRKRRHARWNDAETRNHPRAIDEFAVLFLSK